MSLILKNKIYFDKKYFVNGVECQPLIYNKDKGVLMLKDNNGTFSFIISDFRIKENTIICTNQISYTVKDYEIEECIKAYLDKHKNTVGTINGIASAIREKYYKIPTYLAEVIAEWSMM